MAAKQLPGMNQPINADILDKDNRQTIKRLVIDLTAEEHTAFKREAVDANLSMHNYFQKIWKASKG